MRSRRIRLTHREGVFVPSDILLPRAPRFLYQQAGGNFAEANQVGAKMVGRMRAGDPLLPIQTEPIPGIDPGTATENQFTY